MKSKTDFKKTLRAKILEQAFQSSASSRAEVEASLTLIFDMGKTLEYSPHFKQIRAIVLLFNLAKLLRNTASNLRFQFEGLETESWDIEHVRSAAAPRPVRLTVQHEWLARYQGHLKAVPRTHELQEEIMKPQSVRISASPAQAPRDGQLLPQQPERTAYDRMQPAQERLETTPNR